MKERKDYLIKDSLILFIATSFVNLSNFIFHMFVTRNLSPSDYGALATLLGMVIIFVMPAQALLMSVTKKVSILKANDKINEIINLFKKTTKWFFILGIFYFIFFVIFADFIKSFFNIDDLILIFILAFISIIAVLLPVVRGILQGMQEFIKFGFNMIIDAFFRLFFVVLLIYAGWGVRGALSSSLFSALFAYLLGLLMIKKYFKLYKNENTSSIIKKREIFGYALPVFFSMLGFSLLSYLDLFMVKHFYPKEEAGLYAVTSIIGKAFLYFPMAIAMALFPKVSENFELKLETKNMFFKSLGLTTLISLIGFLFCFFFPEFVIKLLTGGGKYYEIKDIVRIFGIAILPLVLFNVIINYMLAINNYNFIYIMYLGIFVYIILLWYFHDTFYQVIFILFLVNFIIFLLNLFLVFLDSRKRIKENYGF